MTICDSLLSLLFAVLLVSVKNLGVVFIPDKSSREYKDISVSVKDLSL